MKPIAILPDFDASKLCEFSAFNEKFQASGRTAGEALDALIAQSTEASSATPVIVQLFSDPRCTRIVRARSNPTALPSISAKQETALFVGSLLTKCLRANFMTAWLMDRPCQWF